MLAGGSSSLFFLPLSHILAHVVVLCLVHAGKRVGFLADAGQLPAGLAAFRPTILLAVPRVLEKAAAAAPGRRNRRAIWRCRGYKVRPRADEHSLTSASGRWHVPQKICRQASHTVTIQHS